VQGAQLHLVQGQLKKTQQGAQVQGHLKKTQVQGAQVQGAQVQGAQVLAAVLCTLLHSGVFCSRCDFWEQGDRTECTMSALLAIKHKADLGTIDPQ